MILLRKAQIQDLSQLLAIENSWSRSPHWNREQFLRELKLAFSQLWVAEKEGRIVGYLGFWELESEIQITNLATDPRHARQGIALQLLQKLLGHAQKISASKISLEVREDNLSALLLYKKMGWQIVGRRPKFYNDPTCDAILMDHHQRGHP